MSERVLRWLKARLLLAESLEPDKEQNEALDELDKAAGESIALWQAIPRNEAWDLAGRIGNLPLEELRRLVAESQRVAEGVAE